MQKSCCQSGSAQTRTTDVISCSMIPTEHIGFGSLEIVDRALRF